MIVRVLEEGQYELEDARAADLERLDAALEQAIEDEDEAAFAEALDTLLREVRTSGHRVDSSRIVPSDLALPHPGTSLSEMKALLAESDAELSGTS